MTTITPADTPHMVAMLPNDDDELIDLVDEYDVPYAAVSRATLYARRLSNFRVINGFIVTPGRGVWIPRRALHLKMFPGCLDVGVSGHVRSGETYEEALERELMEECGIRVCDVEVESLGTFTPRDGVSSYMKLYSLTYEDEPRFNPADFMEWFCVPIHTGDRPLAKIPKKGDFDPLYKIFLNKRGEAKTN